MVGFRTGNVGLPGVEGRAWWSMPADSGWKGGAGAKNAGGPVTYEGIDLKRRPGSELPRRWRGGATVQEFRIFFYPDRIPRQRRPVNIPERGLVGASIMGLTRDGWGKFVLIVVGAVIGAILGVLGELFIVQWNKAAVYYATGGVYIHSTLGIAVVTLRNSGGSDAENVILTASFANPFTVFSTDRSTTPFEPTAGGDDKKSVTGTIKRLRAGEVVSIFFITEPSSPWADQKPVVRDLMFDGGLGKEGPPWIPREWREIWPLLAALVLFVGTVLVLFRLGRRQKGTLNTRLREAIQLGLTSARDGVSQEQFNSTVEERFGRVLDYKQALMTAAQTAFAWGGQGPSQTAGPTN
jgi:hypothetical protein